tara:strand:- start:151 stop:1017 length:867 start_codon:yes stop_codon:yes gene_type:complete
MKKIININDFTVKLNNKTILENINLTLHGPKIIALVGANGAGKSTLFKSIMGIINPSDGNIIINGKNPKDALKNNLISYVPQIEEVDWNFPLLVEELVMMGRYNHMNIFRKVSIKDKRIVKESLDFVQMNEFINSQIGELSGGQKKRIFIARALAQESKILLLDEPFSGVDINTEESLSMLFRSLVDRGCLIIVSTHNLGSVPRFCDEVILLDKKLLAYGPVKKIFTEDNLKKTFGNMYRQHHFDLITNANKNEKHEVTIISDDERPLVIINNQTHNKVVNNKLKYHD